MKKITKVILAAALVLLVLGAFTGAAAALDVGKMSPLIVDASTSITAAHSAVPVAGSLQQVSGEPASGQKQTQAVVMMMGQKGPGVPVVPFTPAIPPFVPVMPVTLR